MLDRKTLLLKHLAVALVRGALLLIRYNGSAFQLALLLHVSCSALSVAHRPALLIGIKPALLLGFSLVVGFVNIDGSYDVSTLYTLVMMN